VAASDKLIIMGDFNARVGRNSTIWQRVIGKHGVGKNSNATLPRSVVLSHGPVSYNYSARRRPPVARKRRDIVRRPN